jgi:hypothetical protein
MSNIQNSSSPTVLAYNKNDFFWGSIKGINDENCKLIYNTCDMSSNILQTVCDSYPKVCNACNSYTKICDNYHLSNQLQKIQSKHSGAGVRYSDINNQYNNEISKTVKLSIGIVGMLYFYWKLR